MNDIKVSFTACKRGDENDKQLPPPSAVNVCCCCLELAWKKFLWTPYIWLEEEESCGDMLYECFGILLPYEEHRMDKICEVCITQLRSAMNFKRRVLTCRQLLLNNVKELQNIPNLKFTSSIPGVEISDADLFHNDNDCDKELDCDNDNSCDNEVYEELNKGHNNNLVRSVELIKNKLQKITTSKEPHKKERKKISNYNKDALHNKPNLKLTKSTPDVLSDAGELHNIDDYEDELDNDVNHDYSDELDFNVMYDYDDKSDNDVYNVGDDKLNNDVYNGFDEELENDFCHDYDSSCDSKVYEKSDKGHHNNLNDSVEPVLEKKKSRKSSKTKERSKKKLTKLSNNKKLEVQKVKIATSISDDEISDSKKLQNSGDFDEDLHNDNHDNDEELENDALQAYDDSGGNETDGSYSDRDNNINDFDEPVMKKKQSRRTATAKVPPKKKFRKSSNNNEEEQSPGYDETERTLRRVTKKTQNKAKKKSNLSTRSRNVSTKNALAPPAKKITLKKITKKSKKQTNNAGEKTSRRQLNFLKSRQNTCLLLAHSSMLPFKANMGCFFCFYCNEQMAQFEELRRHTARLHRGPGLHDIAARLPRPERVRVDAGRLACSLCRARMRTVDALVDHLARRHAVAFNQHARQPADCVIPYDMSDGKLRCILCAREFLFFKSLSSHMNEHTTNYVCDVCGKCFLLPERLARHRRTHSAAAAPCPRCGRTLRNHYVLQAHLRSAHGATPYACTLCDLKFKSFRDRLRHSEKHHGRKTSDLDCVQCGKSFTVPSTLYAHVKRTHLRIVKPAKLGCDYCGMMFRDKSALRRHIVTHTGERRHACGECGRRFARRSTLLVHARRHAPTQH